MCSHESAYREAKEVYFLRSQSSMDIVELSSDHLVDAHSVTDHVEYVLDLWGLFLSDQCCWHYHEQHGDA